MPTAALTDLIIAQRAMTHLRVDAVQLSSVTVKSGGKEQDLVVDHYGQSVRTLLEVHPWSWAQKYVTLTLSATASDLATHPWSGDWAFAYDKPDDYVGDGVFVANAVAHGARSPGFESARVGDDDLILCNVPEQHAQFRYTFDETDVAKWSAAFGRAVALQLAWDIHGPISTTVANGDRIAQALQEALGHAIAVDAAQLQPTQNTHSDLDRSRHGAGGFFHDSPTP